MSDPTTRLLTANEVAAIFAVTARDVRRWVSEGRLAVARTPGGKLRFWPQDLAPFLLPAFEGKNAPKAPE